jgi:hypothetical protein
LDKFTPSEKLQKNDDVWQQYHDMCRMVETSNTKRNELLQNTNLSVDMFDDILTSVNLLTVDSSDGFEDESIAVLKDVLRQILDIIRFDNCAYLTEQTNPLRTYPQTQEFVRCIDRCAKLTFPDQLERQPFVDRSKVKQRAVHHLTKKWKSSFPPNIWRDIPNHKIFYDLDGGFNDTLAADRMAVLRDLNASDMHEWISVYMSRIVFLSMWAEAILAELHGIASSKADNRVGAHEDLMEK